MVVPNPVQPALSPIHYSIVGLRPNKLARSFNGTLSCAHALDASLRADLAVRRVVIDCHRANAALVACSAMPYQAQDKAQVWNIQVSDKVVTPQRRRTMSRAQM
jgi:hypothetical protein